MPTFNPLWYLPGYTFLPWMIFLAVNVTFARYFGLLVVLVTIAYRVYFVLSSGHKDTYHANG